MLLSMPHNFQTARSNNVLTFQTARSNNGLTSLARLTSLALGNTSSKLNKWKSEKFRFGERLCHALDIDPNSEYSCDEIKSFFKNKSISITIMTIITNDDMKNHQHKVYIFPEKIIEYLNYMLTDKFKMSAKISFISRVIYEVISAEKIRDNWSNYECAEKVPIVHVDSLEVTV